jgi:pimeloyl-ACP methyl ester carboxylesterase
VAESTPQLVSAPSQGLLILVGHSSGGVLAMLIAMRVPDQVAGLLLVNAGADMDGHRSIDMPARTRAEFGAPGWWL